jgi:hypothetical protein
MAAADVPCAHYTIKRTNIRARSSMIYGHSGAHMRRWHSLNRASGMRSSPAGVVRKTRAPLRRTIGAEPLSVLDTCVTKQIKDMVYAEARRLWFLAFGQKRRCVYAFGKRAGSRTSSCRVIRRKRCRYQTCAAPMESRVLRLTAGSVVITKRARKAFLSRAGLTSPQRKRKRTTTVTGPNQLRCTSIRRSISRCDFG